MAVEKFYAIVDTADITYAGLRHIAASLRHYASATRCITLDSDNSRRAYAGHGLRHYAIRPDYATFAMPPLPKADITYLPCHTPILRCHWLPEYYTEPHIRHLLILQMASMPPPSHYYAAFTLPYFAGCYVIIVLHDIAT